MIFRLTLEQRAFTVYALGNVGTGMLLMLVLNPLFLGSNSWAYYTVAILSLIQFLLMGKMNLDAFRLGLVGGFCKNSRGWKASAHT